MATHDGLCDEFEDDGVGIHERMTVFLILDPPVNY
jgi:hypothetical protein